ncbi:signal peptidase I [Lapidilactobacillus wuchangensis]|uniref:signal peptidase I n=1 Tax=Lapidilactobacillus wuchangensis TaxID=2486001 RepID=UPI000F76A26F|nr:signal peptidase I [Lapidilactobacillus wuchangensis]
MAKQLTSQIDDSITWRWWLQLMASMVILFLCTQFILHRLISTDVVSGISMAQNFRDGDQVLTYRHGKIIHGSVIIFDAPNDPGTLYIKRVIGLPGDRVQMNQDRLYINGHLTPEPYLQRYLTGSAFTEDFTLKEKLGVDQVPANSYFVLGDNRPISRDSRRIGFIKQNRIIGTVKMRYWPLNTLQFY